MRNENEFNEDLKELSKELRSLDSLFTEVNAINKNKAKRKRKRMKK